MVLKIPLAQGQDISWRSASKGQLPTAPSTRLASHFRKEHVQCLGLRYDQVGVKVGCESRRQHGFDHFLLVTSVTVTITEATLC